jgi:tetratricopeptide (TPR) repeat protein
MTARRWFALTLTACLAIPLATAPSPARYARPQLAEVPIAKLIDNLERLAVKDPKDAKARLNLARAHAMAYASKADTAEVRAGNEADGVWFGFEPGLVPFTPKATGDEARNKQAQEHLAKAIERYRETVALDPKSPAGRLGLAWCLEQARRKDDAVAAYRALIRDAWMTEKDLKALGLGGRTITAEAAGYLLPLLDADKDREEIAELRDRVARLQKLPRPITPVVVPLRSGLTASDLVDRRARVRFDADGSGLREAWTWFTPDAGILVYDPHRQGKITSALQWFGNVTFWMFWDNGYEALRALDGNGDGVLSGKELAGLAVWIDANGNGVCEPGEVKALAELGIVAIGCRGVIDRAHPDAVASCPTGVTFRDGTTRPTFDVVLRKW